MILDLILGKKIKGLEVQFGGNWNLNTDWILEIIYCILLANVLSAIMVLWFGRKYLLKYGQSVTMSTTYFQTVKGKKQYVYTYKKDKANMQNAFSFNSYEESMFFKTTWENKRVLRKGSIVYEQLL